MAASFYIKAHERETVSQLESLLTASKDRLLNLADIIDRDGGNEVTNLVLHDCPQPERERLDSLLAGLATLNKTELAETRLLFKSCGSFYVQQRTLMMVQLEQQLSAYSSYVDLLATLIGPEKTVSYPVERWQTLTTMEQERLKYVSELVILQDDIITALSEPNANQKKIEELANKAQQTRNFLSGLGPSIDSIRTALQ